MADKFMPQLGHYSKLIAYQKAECIYDVTYYFVNNHLAKGDRTVDQMLQARAAASRTLPRAARRPLRRARLR